MEDWRKSLLSNVEKRKKKNFADTLRQNRLAEEEMQKATPEYKEQKQKDQLKDQLKTRRELQEEKRKSTPSEDILRFGKKRQQFRDLAYKTSAVQRKIDGENVVDQEGKPVRDLVFTEIPGNELFKEQAQAYGDSLKLAGLAQKFGTTTPDIRKIDRSRGEITNEILANVKKYMKEASGLDPKVQRELAEKRATQDLIKKYGKGIIPLLTQLKNR
jgi:hypothetical protein